MKRFLPLALCVAPTFLASISIEWHRALLHWFALFNMSQDNVEFFAAVSQTFGSLGAIGIVVVKLINSDRLL